MNRLPLRRTAAIAATTLLLTTGATAAWADEPTPPVGPTVSVDGDQVTITTDLATAQALCARVDTARDRLTRLLERIQGDADTAGSVAWLRARAQHASDEGRGDQSGLLTQRADRRSSWVDEIDAGIDRLDRADANVCAALPGADE